MPSTDPLWFCHQCNAEMHPLFVPDPHCASCNGTFVEQIDPADDPRMPTLETLGGVADDDNGGGFPDPLFQLFRALGVGSPTSSPQDTSRDPHSQPSRSPSNSDPSPNRPRHSVTFQIRSSQSTNGPGGPQTRTFVFGGPNTLGRNPARRPGEPERDGPGMTLPEYFQTFGPGPGGGAGNANGDDEDTRRAFNNPLLLQQYLMTMLGVPMGMGIGGGTGRMGDYVFSQEALEQIMNQLMENGSKPVPLPEKDIDNLERGVLAEDSPLLGNDCQVCQDAFEVPKEGEEKEPGMLTTITLPCKHSYHEDCIVPWLKQSGTCPVCRHALIEQPQPHGANNTGNGPSGSGSNNNNEGNGNRPGLFNFFSAFSGAGGGHSSSGGGGANNGSTTGTQSSNPPGAWHDVD